MMVVEFCLQKVQIVIVLSRRDEVRKGVVRAKEMNRLSPRGESKNSPSV